MADSTPHAAMPHADDGLTGPHGTADDHGSDHGHDDHAHGSAGTLGPADVRAWGYGLFGIVLGLAVAIAIALGSGFITR